MDNGLKLLLFLYNKEKYSFHYIEYLVSHTIHTGIELPNVVPTQRHPYAGHVQRGHAGGGGGARALHLQPLQLVHARLAAVGWNIQ